MVSSGTSFAASGGKSDLSVSFGAASYSFSRNEFGYIGSDENSGWQNFGYVLGALANLSDAVNLLDSYKAAQRIEQTPEEQAEIVAKKYRTTKRDNYIGANGKGNPEIAWENGIHEKQKW